jgi:hypothetical protein
MADMTNEAVETAMETNDTAQNSTNENAETELTIEQQVQALTEQNQALMTEIAKLKKTSDKNASEAAKYKRQYRETLSAQEQASQDKAEKEAERQEQFEKLLRENKINKYMRQYMGLGYSEEQADKAATARADGDEDTLFKIQSEVQKQMLNSAKAEWMRTRPEVNAGTQQTVTAEQFAKMGITERTELKRKSPEIYEKLAHKK